MVFLSSVVVLSFGFVTNGVLCPGFFVVVESAAAFVVKVALWVVLEAKEVG